MNTARVIINTNDMEWVSTGVGGGEAKLLRLNEDFSYINLFRAQGNTVGPAHVHLGPTEVFFLSGEVETVAGRAGEGFWVLEPAGAMHRATQIYVGGVALNHMNGPMALIAPDGSVPPLIYGQSLKATLDGTSKGLSGGALTNVLYPENYNSGIVDMKALAWLPSGYEGVKVKVLRVFDNGHYTMMVKAQDGAVIPPRRYTAPADFYVLSGCLRFGEQDAAAEHWVYEPMGATEGTMRHVGETTYLATCTGAILDFGTDGKSVERIVDGFAIQEISRELVAAE